MRFDYEVEFDGLRDGVADSGRAYVLAILKWFGGNGQFFVGGDLLTRLKGLKPGVTIKAVFEVESAKRVTLVQFAAK